MENCLRKKQAGPLICRQILGLQTFGAQNLVAKPADTHCRIPTPPPDRH
jgi:hypothetical protein